MRDLANQNYPGSRKNFSRTAKIIVLAIVFSALVWFFNNRAANPTSTSGSIILNDAPKGLTPVGLPNDITSAGQAVNLKSDKAVFSNVSDAAAKATAVRKYGDGTYTLAVEATLPDPKGLKYEVWIIGGEGSQEAGFLNGSDTTFTLVFRDKDYYSKNNGIWITREITDNDGKAEKHILEGSF